MANIFNDAAAATGEEALSLVSSFGGGSATNCYLGLTAANSLITNHTLEYSAWTSASTLLRQIAIIKATDTIDALPWWGDRYYGNDYEQGLAFPRTSECLPAHLWPLDEEDMLASQEDTLARACAFQTLYTLANSATSLHADNIRQGLGSYSYTLGGALSESFGYKGGAAARPATWTSLCEDAQREMRGYQLGRRLARA